MASESEFRLGWEELFDPDLESAVDELLLEASQQYEALTADSKPPPGAVIGHFGPLPIHQRTWNLYVV